MGVYSFFIASMAYIWHSQKDEASYSILCPLRCGRILDYDSYTCL